MGTLVRKDHICLDRSVLKKGGCPSSGLLQIFAKVEGSLTALLCANFYGLVVLNYVLGLRDGQ